MNGYEHVATIQLPDIYDERDGVYLSGEDLRKLASLPAGTKLYIERPGKDFMDTLEAGLFELNGITGGDE